MSECPCTFSQGYVYQPVFACRTCTTPDGADPAGFCMGCSIHCHAGHEVIELYMKRNFRCDCGTTRFPDGPACQLSPKEPGTVNDRNEYNHNYFGRYCTCDQIFDWDTMDSYMKQCMGCQDWFHRECMPNAPLTVEEYDMVICEACVKKYGLHSWKPLCVQHKQRVCLTQGTVKESEPEEALGAELEPMWIYLKLNWRDHLCDCAKCEAKYAALPFQEAFDIDEEDEEEDSWEEEEEEEDGDLTGAMAGMNLHEASQ